MTQHEHKIGFTYTQLLATIGLFGGIVSVWVGTNVKIAEIKENARSFRAEYDQQKEVYERQRQEQRDDYKTLSGKIDKLFVLKSEQ